MRHNPVEHLWRIAGTGLAFVVLFGGGGLLSLTVFALRRLLVADAQRRADANQQMIHRLFGIYVWFLRTLRIIDLDIVGPEHLAAGRGRMIVANHPTLLDVVLLMALVPRAQCIVKGELWSNRYLGGVVREAGYIRNDLVPDALLEECRRALDRGCNLIIFPEGTRSVPGQPLRFRRGFANIATLLSTNIQLVTITCAPPFLRKGDAWWVVPALRPHFKVTACDRIEPTLWQAEARSIAARRLVRHLESYFVERLANG